MLYEAALDMEAVIPGRGAECTVAPSPLPKGPGHPQMALRMSERLDRENVTTDGLPPFKMVCR